MAHNKRRQKRLRTRRSKGWILVTVLVGMVAGMVIAAPSPQPSQIGLIAGACGGALVGFGVGLWFDHLGSIADSEERESDE